MADCDIREYDVEPADPRLQTLTEIRRLSPSSQPFLRCRLSLSLLKEVHGQSGKLQPVPVGAQLDSHVLRTCTSIVLTRLVQLGVSL